MSKGGGDAPQVVVYTADVAISFCEGPIHRFVKAWFDETLVWQNGGRTDPNIRGGVEYSHLGDETQTADSTIEAEKGAGNVPAFRGLAYMVFKDVNLTAYGNRIPNVTVLIEKTDGYPSLAEAISAITGYGGLDSEYIDVAKVTSTTLSGYAISGLQAPGGLVTPLMTAFLIDAQEVDGVLVFFNRTQRRTVVVSEGDLGATSEGSDATPSLTLKDTSSLGTPTRLYVNYLDSTLHYQQGTQMAKRVTARIPNETSVDIPVAMMPASARAIADRLIWSAYHERMTAQFNLPATYAIAEADLVLVPYKGATYNVRVTQVDKGANYILSVQGVVESSAATGDEPDDPVVIVETPPEQQVVEVLDPTVVIADIPYVRTQEMYTCGVYVGASIPTVLADSWSGSLAHDPVFRGSAIYLSYDGGTTYIYTGISFAAPEQSLIGKAVTTLTDGTTRISFDTTDTVTVVLGEPTQSLASTTDLMVTGNYVNIAYFGTGEVLSYVNATLQTPSYGDTGGRYVLDRLARGLRNTVMTGHASNESFLCFNGVVKVVPIDPRYIGSTLYIKVVPAGQDLDSVTGHSFTFENNMSRPWAPVDLGVTRVLHSGTAGRYAWDVGVSWSDPDPSLHAIFGTPGENYSVYSVTFSDATFDITSASWSSGSGGKVTFTTTGQHPMNAGEVFVISGATPSAYNGTYTADTIADFTHITATKTSDPGTYSSGATGVWGGPGVDFIGGNYTVIKDTVLVIRATPDQIDVPYTMVSGHYAENSPLCRKFACRTFKVSVKAIGTGVGAPQQTSPVVSFWAPDV